MVKIPSSPPAEAHPARTAERDLAFGYARSSDRAALAALFALDETLAQIIRSTREPIVGQMRLTWWYEALVGLDTAPPPAEPVLRALHADVLPRGVAGTALAAMIDGWEALLEPVLDDAAIERFATDRGGRLFAMAATCTGSDDTLAASAGRGWAIADLARHVADPVIAETLRARASAMLVPAFERQWPRATRPLGALGLIARFDVSTPTLAAGAPRRVARLAWHRLTGR